ncbi:MAG: hypothetical protein A3I91_01840 [Candidatus Kerfeldbacteria bacterium RIFCSPLOWO2_02_FULL_42_19]|nr:MAG: hypothetical protein A3E60_02870 [Candidatus Kerfeldbacteria bacterium RIFCSPHIGHO2_12_FULL_42_13]OGY83374.1 MAG: hypothetical protein A3I91_01840 [Candidatus Kerfeldbacteria bacterium RIFCSPLOWO2_02_FULL_42_19]OGY86364.1 MAG: hypothetical protein A3G01_05200 [Candidatus Kerfeldbacteria bacterium RIFCSPLOWO2_12_FULL_43_9]
MNFFSRYRFFLVSLFTLSLFILGSRFSAAAFFQHPPRDQNVAPVARAQQQISSTSEILIKLHSSFPHDLTQLQTDLQVFLGFRIESIEALSPDRENRWYALTFPVSQDVIRLQSHLSLHPLVEAVAPNTRFYIVRTPNDTDFSLQTHLNQNSDADIDALEAWDITTGENSVVVAVVDSGVDTDHPDLVDRIWTNTDEIAGNGVDDDSNGFIDDVNGWDFADDNNDPNPAPDGIDNDDYAGTDTGVTHGTHVSGIIAATGNNALGISGVSWAAMIMPVRALDDEGAGTTDDIAAAINYAVANGADIINMSFGALGSDQAMDEAVAAADAAGLVLIAAVGNSALDVNTFPFYPACNTNVLGVGAVDADDTAASFTNFGSDCTDVSAPGVNIYSTLYTNDPDFDFTDDYGLQSGTSMAAPIVSGIAALILSVQSGLTNSQVMQYISSNTDDVGLGTEMGSGRVNAVKALLDLQGAPSTPSNLRAWTNSKKSTTIQEKTATKDSTPFFTWDASSAEAGMKDYYVYFGTDATADPAKKGKLQRNTNFQPPAELNGNQVSYFLRIKARDNNKVTSPGVATFEYIIDNTVSKLQKVAADLTDDEVAVSWNKSEFDSDVKGFRVLRSTQENGTFKDLSGLLSTLVETFRDKDVFDGRLYFYKVVQVDTLGNNSNATAVRIKFNKQDRILAAPAISGGPQVRVFNEKGKLLHQFFAYSESFRGGVRLASCDLDGNGNAEVITAPGLGGGPQVRVFDMNGKTKFTQGFFAYPSNFKGGVFVACGDLDGDGRAEIITGTGAGGGPQVRVFDKSGNTRFTPGFFPYDSKFRGGVRVASGDVNGDGIAEIITAPGPGGGPQVRLFDRTGKPVLVAGGFMAYASSFKGGVNLAIGDIDQDGAEEIITGVGASGSPLVRAFHYKGTTIESEFSAFDQSFKGGIVVAGGFE